MKPPKFSKGMTARAERQGAAEFPNKKRRKPAAPTVKVAAKPQGGFGVTPPDSY